MKKNIATIFILGIMMLFGCSKPDFKQLPVSGSVGTIHSYLSNSLDLSLFAYAVQRSGLADSLDQVNAAYTIWPPLNSALNKEGIYNNADWDKWSADSIKYFVKTYLIKGKLFYSDLPIIADNQFVNLNGQTLYVTKASTVNNRNRGLLLSVDGVAVQSSGSLSSTTFNYGTTALNGVVYPLISTIKIFNGTVAQFLQSQTKLKVLSAGLNKFGLMDRLSKDGNFTVVAPQDDAFTGYGITLDSVSKMNTSKIDPILFGIYFLEARHLFLLDLQQLNKDNLEIIAYKTISDSIQLSLNVNGNGTMIMSAVAAVPQQDQYSFMGPGGIYGPYNPNSGIRFLGEGRKSPYDWVTSISPPIGTYINYTCSNGIVHLLSGVLLLPDEVTRQ